MVQSMSSSGPYQSRLFNLLNRYKIRWSDRVTQAVRQIQIATEWGIQTLLYPIYLMVQMGRSTRQQLEQQVQSSSALPPGSELELDAQIQFSAVDAPIEKVLQAVKPWLIEGNEEKRELEDKQTNIWGKLSKFVAQLRSPIPKQIKIEWFRHQNKALELTENRLPQQGENLVNLAISDLRSRSLRDRQSLILNSHLDETNSLPRRNKRTLAIQGIATLVESRVLVLVTQDNQILDILTSQQQQQLQQRIIQALAAYRPHRGFLKTTTKKILQSLPNFSSNNSKALPPVRFVWNIIDWLQTSPVALKTNLFGESSLVSVSSESTEISYKRSPLEELSIILDRALAGLETQSQNLVTLVHQVGNNLSYKINQTGTLKQRQSPGENLNATREHSEPDPFQIQVLIKAAIDYFFGKVYGNDLSHSSSKIPLQPTTSSSSLPTASPEDPWLSWSDLFSDTFSSPTIAQTSQRLVTLKGKTDKKSLPEAIHKPTKSKQWKKNRIKSRLQPLKSRALSVVQTHLTNVTLKPQESSTLNATDNSTGAEVLHSRQTTPDWVETDATAVGYVKHPLEILLEWLDRTILWLEELALKIWKQVISFTQRRKER
ncbi:hypothetical protein IQ238_09675 [Pleurocapsales cyanobacterium LEGE 06147]|nr:hypothetical protein [Pleurocapsales cyanobacterium LEGE 06147]